nr:hypothetical protein [Tanacetum cinerariifolium]
MANDVTFLFCIMLWLLEARNVSIFMCTRLFRSCVAEYGARYVQVVAVHTTYTLEIETIVNHDWSIILATSLCDALSRIFGGVTIAWCFSLITLIIMSYELLVGRLKALKVLFILENLSAAAGSPRLADKMKYVFGRSRGEDDSFTMLMTTNKVTFIASFIPCLRKKYRLSLKNDIPPRDKNYNHTMTHHKLMRDLCLALRISLSKKRRLVAELEALGEQEGVAKPLERIRDIVAHDVVTLGEFETLLACA